MLTERVAQATGARSATIRNAEKLYTGLNVIRQTISDWSSEADIGITVRNVDASQIELRRVEGFTIGMRTLGDVPGDGDADRLGEAVLLVGGLDLVAQAQRMLEKPADRAEAAGDQRLLQMSREVSPHTSGIIVGIIGGKERYRMRRSL